MPGGSRIRRSTATWTSPGSDELVEATGEQLASLAERLDRRLGVAGAGLEPREDEPVPPVRRLALGRLARGGDRFVEPAELLEHHGLLDSRRRGPRLGLDRVTSVLERRL